MFTKTSMLAATALSMVSTAAFAGTPNVYPAANLQGNGASSIATVLVQETNCFGGSIQPLGLTTPATQTIPDFNYVPPAPTGANPTYNCASQHIQPNVQSQYVSTGSGGGKTSWSKGDASGIAANPFGTWTNIHFAFSDSAIGAGDITTYNANAKIKAGAPIQIPMFVLPIAIAYSPLYGKVNTASGVKPLNFNVKVPRADGTGGLKISEASLCAIANGTLTNWNDNRLKVDNGNTSLMSANDDPARWASAGVPITLVGRSDNSGTTNLFSRHLAAVCAGTDFATAGTGADQLPSSRKGSATYNATTGVLSAGTETAGLFGLVSGSGGIANTVGIAIADPASVGQYTFNGRLGYVGADYTRPATVSASQLSSADVQNGVDKKYYAPTSKNAQAATTTSLPPQSAKTGKYDPTVTTAGNRNDPLAWVQAPNNLTGYAKPAKGYPILGTTNMLLYTCYSNAAVRVAIQGLALEHLGKVATDSLGNKVPAKLASNVALGSSGAPLGIDPGNGIAPLPAAWSNAIIETFLTKVATGANPASLGLYIQDKQPKKTADIIGPKGAAVANPSCAVAQGGTGTYAGI